MTHIISNQSIGCAIERFTTKYDKYVLVGDFNAEEGEEKMGNFLEIYLVHDKMCCNPLNPEADISVLRLFGYIPEADISVLRLFGYIPEDRYIGIYNYYFLN